MRNAMGVRRRNARLVSLPPLPSSFSSALVDIENIDFTNLNDRQIHKAVAIAQEGVVF
jgi:hypothetical protein